MLGNRPARFLGGGAAATPLPYPTSCQDKSESIAWGIQDPLAEMSTDVPGAYQVALDLILRTASDQSILGMSDHLLYVGKKVS